MCLLKMSDQGNGNLEQTKDMKKENAPTRGVLINHAVTFLLDKKIRDQDPSLLRKFLIKKGLTEEEASIAFQRFEAQKNQSTVPTFHQHPLVHQHYVTQPLPVPSVWHTVHRVITTITSIGGIIYAIYWLWKNYISTYLFGRKPKKKPVEAVLSDLEAAVGKCAADVSTVRISVETMAAERAAEITSGPLVTKLQELKSEISSLKTLLLNRNQFPTPPTSLGTGSLSIPSWQMMSQPSQTEPEAEHEEEGSGSNGGTNGSDSSLEIIHGNIFRFNLQNPVATEQREYKKQTMIFSHSQLI